MGDSEDLACAGAVSKGFVLRDGRRGNRARLRLHRRAFLDVAAWANIIDDMCEPHKTLLDVTPDRFIDGAHVTMRSGWWRARQDSNLQPSLWETSPARTRWITGHPRVGIHSASGARLGAQMANDRSTGLTITLWANRPAPGR